jgi:predicted RNA methylase
MAEALSRASKSGKGAGIPEAILIDRATNIPLAVIEAKESVDDIGTALKEAEVYGDAFWKAGSRPLAIGLAGTTEDEVRVRVSKKVGAVWKSVTYDNYPISWIPTRADLERIAVPSGPTEIRPTIPPLEVLAQRADEINRLLREARIKDEYRPAVVAAVMLALWRSRGEIRREPQYILRDINESCRDAFIKAGKADLAKSLRVDEANDKLKEKVRRIATILERLNVTVLTAEHDYLGQLYETFFRYTGGNTIGQYFTPRHITRMMADICEVTRNDVVLDPACGTGGFLVACMDRVLTEHHLSRAQMVKIVKTQLIGFEDEPVTAALCVANMILRGDGSTGIHKADCFRSTEYPDGRATVVLMNPPFPHQKTDTPVEDFVTRALDGLKDRGKLAVILPMSMLVKKDKGGWRKSILDKNTLLAACQMPDELFQPFAAATTAFVVIEKGIPHSRQRKSMFVRLHHDGLALRKGARVERLSEPNQIPKAVDAIVNKVVTPGFAGSANVKGMDEWSPGAYISSAEPEEGELRKNVDVLLRRLASFYTRYAQEIIVQRRAILDGDIALRPYREMLTTARIRNAGVLPTNAGTVGSLFDIFYGMKELHSREGYATGRTLIISPTEEYNGCYGWLEYPEVLQPPFVTVAQTGSIGESFVQMEPCAVNDDCLVLLPKEGIDVPMPKLVLAAACMQAEKWRFTYGRKLTPSRIAEFKLTQSAELDEWITTKLRDTAEVIRASLSPYETEDERDASTARLRLDQLENPASALRLIKGRSLESALLALEA